jgi:hypothetical protein
LFSDFLEHTDIIVGGFEDSEEIEESIPEEK